eukprot:7388650-Prymnesium_polylepis.1
MARPPSVEPPRSAPHRSRRDRRHKGLDLTGASEAAARARATNSPARWHPPPQRGCTVGRKKMGSGRPGERPSLVAASTREMR